MTTEAGRPLDAPPAGRELDALVRDTVFGPWDESRCRVCGWKIVPDGEQGCWKDNCSMRFPHGMYPPRADEPQPYSTDIAAAWEVLNRFPNWAMNRDNQEPSLGSPFSPVRFLTQRIGRLARARNRPLRWRSAVLRWRRAMELALIGFIAHGVSREQLAKYVPRVWRPVVDRKMLASGEAA